MLPSRFASGAKERMNKGKRPSPTASEAAGFDLQIPIPSDWKIHNRKEFRRTPQSTRFEGESPFRSMVSNFPRNSLIRSHSSISASYVPFGIRWSWSWMPMYVAKIGFCRTNQSTTSFPRDSTCASDIGPAIAQGPLALSPTASHRDPATALVPAIVAEVLGARELFSRENRPVDTHQFIVEGTRVADPDAAFHVPLEARLDGDAPFARELHDRIHHLLRTARDHLLARSAPEELVRPRGHEPMETAGAVVRRDVHLTARVRPFDEQEFLRVLGPDRRHDPGALVREGLDRGDHGGHAAPAADREDGLALQVEHVPVRPSDSDPVPCRESREGMGRVPVVADRDALDRSEGRQGHRKLVVSRDPHHQELARLTPEVRAEAVRHRGRSLPDDLQEGNDLDPRHARPRSPRARSGSRPLPRGGPFPWRPR